MGTSFMGLSRRGLLATGAAGVGASLGGLGILGRAEAAVRPVPVNLTNVSYDATRRVYGQLNAAFAAQWKARTGQPISVTQAHGGSIRQHDLLKSGMPADVATLAHPAHGLSRRAPRPAPYTSTVAFMVRPGNPKGVLDWRDLSRPDVEVVATNPRTSAAGRYAYLSAWSAVAGEDGEAEAVRMLRAMYRRVVVLDTSSSAASNTLIRRETGDVVVTWEHEALQMLEDHGPEVVEVVYPSSAVAMEPFISLVDAHVQRHGSAVMAKAYLDFLYCAEAQEIMTSRHLRTRAGEARHAGPARLVTVADLGGWDRLQERHFGRDLDRILAV